MRRRLPGEFRLSVKAPRGLTHANRLYAPEHRVERLARCCHELGPKRAVLLVQLGPGQAKDDRLDSTYRRAPRTGRLARDRGEGGLVEGIEVGKGSHRV